MFFSSSFIVFKWEASLTGPVSINIYIYRIPLMGRCTTLCDKVCQWLATGQWFSPGTPVSSTNKTDHHDIPEILLKVALNTIIVSPIYL